MTFTSYKNDIPQSNVIKRHHDVKNRPLTSLKRLNDVINLWLKKAHSHATKTGVHHLKTVHITILLFKNVPFGPMRSLHVLGYIITAITAHLVDIY